MFFLPWVCSGKSGTNGVSWLPRQPVAPGVTLDLSRSGQFDQMSKNGLRRRPAQSGAEPDIDGLGDLRDRRLPLREPPQDRGAPFPPMVYKGAHVRLGIGNSRAVRRKVERVVAVEQLLERAQV